MSRRDSKPVTGISPKAEGWLWHHARTAHILLDAEEPFLARDALADSELEPRQIVKLNRYGITKVDTREQIRRVRSDRPSSNVVGHSYRLTAAAARYIEANIPDPRTRDGWCTDPSCGRRSITHDDSGPHCPCGAPIEEESDE